MTAKVLKNDGSKSIKGVVDFGGRLALKEGISDFVVVVANDPKA